MALEAFRHGEFGESKLKFVSDTDVVEGELKALLNGSEVRAPSICEEVLIPD